MIKHKALFMSVVRACCMYSLVFAKGIEVVSDIEKYIQMREQGVGLWLNVMMKSLSTG